MRIPRHWLLTIGAASFIAAVAVLASGMGAGPAGVQAGGTTEPTIDPCLAGTTNLSPGGVVALTGEVCVTATRRPAFTHTPTPRATEGPTEAPPTEGPTEEATEPPAATSTPSGGAGAGGIAPPNTGTGGGEETANGMWLLLLAGTLAAAGAGATVAGYRSR